VLLDCSEVAMGVEVFPLEFVEIIGVYVWLVVVVFDEVELTVEFIKVPFVLF
jgi:hypothetical protein